MEMCRLTLVTESHVIDVCRILVSIRSLIRNMEYTLIIERHPLRLSSSLDSLKRDCAVVAIDACQDHPVRREVLTQSVRCIHNRVHRTHSFLLVCGAVGLCTLGRVRLALDWFPLPGFSTLIRKDLSSTGSTHTFRS